MRRWTAVVVVTAMAALAGPARAQVAIPESPAPPTTLPPFVGGPASPRPVAATEPPRHPRTAANGRSNIHVDAHQTDANAWFGPLGRGIERRSTFELAECASLTFDRRGRIVTACVGLEGPRLVLMDARTLATLATFPLPPRDPTSGNPFTSFGGGGYFYLDHRDRAIVPTTTRQVMVIRQTEGPGFALERTYDLGAAVRPGDSITSALPDWSGRIWFVSNDGVVGTVDPTSGAVRSLRLPGEEITDSFAVDATGGVFIVSDRALYRFDATRGGSPQATWRETYANTGEQKPGQVNDGSGTTPTLMEGGLVAITDNADPINVVVMRRGRRVQGRRTVCTHPVFRRGESATDNSLVAARRSIVVENNYGYTGPGATQLGRTTTGGVERIDLDRDGVGCRRVWRSQERSPSVVPKLSLATGLVYVYTKDPQTDDSDAWYLTALDFRTGRTVFKALGGEGLGYNNNYAPITLGPDGTAYVGVLGGLIALRDRVSPAAARPRVSPRAARQGDGRTGCATRLSLAGADLAGVRSVTYSVAGRRLPARAGAPFAVTLRVRPGTSARRVRADVRMRDGRRTTAETVLRACASRRVSPRLTG
jgi:hypothetical protein